MAKIYGERWEVSSGRTLDKGQGNVVRVVDLRGDLQGAYALKCIAHPKLNHRFRREISDITDLRHPNIIALVDPAAFVDETGAPEKQYLVMPIAPGGDLGHHQRAHQYKGDVEGVVAVGKQLASALMTAHAGGVIHRNLKPGNVLFSGPGKEIWLSDFGVCLVREPVPLDAGADSFLAPELKGGTQLDVTPAADVYSLGAILYYMLSGGGVPASTRMGEAKPSSNLREGRQRKALHASLTQMICPLEERLKTMPEVLGQLGLVASGSA